jgi:hypothetical protein
MKKINFFFNIYVLSINMLEIELEKISKNKFAVYFFYRK